MSETENILSAAESGERITYTQALTLWEEAPLARLGLAAYRIKRRLSGDSVFHNRNFHIEPTNICRFNCRFCSYRREAGSPEAWDLSMDEVVGIARGRRESGATEVHIVGGVHPHHDLHYYADMIRRVKQELPGAVVKAFTAVELSYMIDKAGLSLKEGLSLLQAAGMEAIPGGGAEIFDPEIRERICPEKCPADVWLDVHRQAHLLGISTNATMLYGHIEEPRHRIGHMERLRRLQDETGGFNAFIPLKYRSFGNPMAGSGETPVTDDIRTLALARIYLDNFPHVKAYWPMYGKVTTELALCFGADDIDGTIEDSTRIYSMAGAEEQKPVLTVSEIEAIAARTGLTAVERDSFYNPVKK